MFGQDFRCKTEISWTCKLWISCFPNWKCLWLYNNKNAWLTKSKSMDVYDLNARLFKNYRSLLCKPLTHVINSSIRSLSSSSSWKTVASKIAKKVGCDQLTCHLNEGKSAFQPLQFDFQKYHSTETANSSFVEQIKISWYLGKDVIAGTVFLDFKKAFDTGNHNILLSKLSKLNLSDDALAWMEFYLNQRKQCTRVCEKHSSVVNCTDGVLQGSI